MIKKLTPLILAIFLITSGFRATYIAPAMQSSNAGQITAAIGKGNASDIAKHFGANVDLKLPGNDGTFSKNHAELVLKNFFTQNPPRSFSIQHQGPSRDGSVYVIGSYSSTNNKTFRTYFLMKKIDDKMVLHLLQMDEQ